MGITELLLSGVCPSVAFEPDGEHLELSPADRATPELMELTRRHKSEIIGWMTVPTLPHPKNATTEDWAHHREAMLNALFAPDPERVLDSLND